MLQAPILPFDLLFLLSMIFQLHASCYHEFLADMQACNLTIQVLKIGLLHILKKFACAPSYVPHQEVKGKVVGESNPACDTQDACK